MKKEAKEIETKKQKSLSYSIKDGAASSVHSSIEATFIPQLALALKGSAFQVGLISAFSGLLSPLAQILGDKLLEKKPRKKILLTFITIQIFLVLIIAGLAYLYYKNIFQNELIYGIIGVYTLITICSGILYPAWFSLIGDLVPKDCKGKFFSKRNIITTLAGLIIIPLGLILDKMEAFGYLMLGFSLLFIIAAIARAVSLIYISKHYSPKFKLHKGYYFSLRDFIKRFDDVGKFAIYYAIFQFALMIASPFFAVYMKNVLQLDYLQITIISLSSSIFYMLFSPLMGKISDRHGNIKLLYISTLLFSLNPFLWTFIKSFIGLTLIPQLVTGLANAAMGIAVTNFIYNMTRPEHRALCMSYLNILAGIGIFFGSIAGGLIIKLIPETFIFSPFIAMFIISGVARLLVSLFFVGKLKETEDNAKPFPRTRISFLHPIHSIHSEISLIKKITHEK